MVAGDIIGIKLCTSYYVDMQLDHGMFFDAGTKGYLTRYNEAAVRAIAAEQEG